MPPLPASVGSAGVNRLEGSRSEDTSAKIVDPGHDYELSRLDGSGVERLRFVKREGAGYPGNIGSHEGTNIQEVLRVLINRTRYLNRQIPCAENDRVVLLLQESIFALERRAAKRHGLVLSVTDSDGIEGLPVCEKCGHIECRHPQCPSCGSRNTEVCELLGHTYGRGVVKEMEKR